MEPPAPAFLLKQSGYVGAYAAHQRYGLKSIFFIAAVSVFAAFA